MKNFIAGALIGGASLMGLGLGAGHAEAKIEPGDYVMQAVQYGFAPTPESNVRIRGNVLTQDVYGVGPKNQGRGYIVPTRDGGNVSALGTRPEQQWFSRVEFHRSKNGYVGTSYRYGGIPMGTFYLRKTKRQANQPR